MNNSVRGLFFLIGINITISISNKAGNIFATYCVLYKDVGHIPVIGYV